MKKNSYFVPLAIVGMMFFVLGFAVGINSLLIPFLREAFGLTKTSSYLVIAATFMAYVIFGFPAGQTIKKIGYKKSISIAFFIIALGMYLFIPSANHTSFPLFLLALFIGGAGSTLLQAAVNPYVTILGPKEGGAKRISIMGICNKTATALAPVVLAVFLNINDARLEDVITPFYAITAILVLLGVGSCFLPLPEVTAEGEDEEEGQEHSAVAVYASSKSSIFQFPHLMLGALALFFDVGVEIIALSTIVDYANTIGLASPEIYAIYTTAFMILGYCCGMLFIPKYLSQQRALLYCASTGVLTALLVVFMPLPLSVWFVAVLGFANSLLWPSIWPLAIADLGKYTKSGSSMLVIAIVGGALIPLLFGWIAEQASMQQAYWICVPVYLYLIFYATKGYRLR